ncbi:MAG: ATP-binding cassette, subfamily B, bacterial MsbA [Elusimicrobia bacterium]|nr:MAG: ATP-binding cassette, subfamily B, bacterial MsbA [Elusimicrobiota bacterium]
MRGWERFLPYVRPHRLRFAQAGVAMVVVAASNGLILFLLKLVTDGVFLQSDILTAKGVLTPYLRPLTERMALGERTNVVLIAMAVPAFMFLKSVAGYAQNYLMSWIGQRISQELREDLFTHLHRLSLDYYTERRAGEILARATNDLSMVQSTLQFAPLYLVRDLLTVATCLGVLFWRHARFATMALLVAPFAAAVLVVLGRKMRDASKSSQEIMGTLYHRFQESLQGMMLIKAFNYEEGAVARFKAENEAFFVEMMRYLRATALSGPLMEFIGSLIIAGVIYMGGLEILSGRMTPGDFAMFAGAFFVAYAPLKNLGKLNSELQRGLASGDRIFEILDEVPRIVQAEGAVRFGGLKGSVRLAGLTFRYPSRDAAALSEVNLELRKGETLAVVGPSGSGKSTLAQLLLRLYDPAEGAVLVDGADLRTLDIRSWRERVGIVTQETVLFNDTVAGNLAIGRPGASRDEIERAAAVADAARFIEALPQGYDTPLGDRGLRLSGGQRQRLAIARAVLREPDLLILDEATSNLDSKSESEIQGALDKVMKGRTALVIAHRLSTIQGADRIVVLEAGRVVETGTHRQLLSSGGVYKRLWEMQAGEEAHAP